MSTFPVVAVRSVANFIIIPSLFCLMAPLPQVEYISALVCWLLRVDHYHGAFRYCKRVRNSNGTFLTAIQL